MVAYDECMTGINIFDEHAESTLAGKQTIICLWNNENEHMS